MNPGIEGVIGGSAPLPNGENTIPPATNVEGGGGIAMVPGWFDEGDEGCLFINGVCGSSSSIAPSALGTFEATPIPETDVAEVIPVASADGGVGAGGGFNKLG